jgi:N-carbamoylputrescine amidase
MKSSARQVEENIEQTRVFVQEAGERGVDIVCFPELCITGYILDHPESIYSPEESKRIIERVLEMARKSEITVIAGMIEMGAKQSPYITQIVAGPEGYIGSYRKTHLAPPEKGKYRPGEKIEVFQFRNIRFGIQLCYESHFPEISRIMALRGADVIFIPHASPRGTPQEKLQSWLRHLPGRAFDNTLFVAACNQVGETGEGNIFPGVAVVIHPSGHVISRYTGHQSTMLVADLNLDELRAIKENNMKYFMPHRRPDLYGELSSQCPQPFGDADYKT